MSHRKFYVFAGLSLLLYLWAFPNQILKSSLPPDFDVASLAYPLRIQGVTVDTGKELRFLVEGWPPGDTVEIRSASGPPRSVELVHADSLSYRLTAFISGIFFWLIAAFVLAPRCDNEASKYFFWMTLLYGLGIGLGGVYFNPQVWSARTLFSFLQFGVLAFLPPIFMGLARTFPRVLPLPRPLVRGLPALWFVAAFLTLWQFATYQMYFLNPTPALAAKLALPGQVADLVMILQALGGITLLVFQMRGLELTRERQQAKWVLVGFVVGATPYVFIRNVVQLMGHEAPLPHHVDRVFELAIPLAFGMAIAKYRFLDIDIIIRRGVIYGTLAGVMTGLFLVVGYLIGLVAPDPDGPWHWVHLIMTGVTAGLLFPYVRRGLGRWVDRTFFRITYSHRRSLADLRRKLELVVDPESLVRLLAEQVTQTLGPGLVGVVAGNGAGQRVAGNADPYQIRRWWAGFKEARLGPRMVATPGSTSLPEWERDDFPAALREDGIILVQPIAEVGVFLGGIMCGPRPTGRRYVEKDLMLLKDFATLSQEILSRIALTKAVVDEGMERQRLDELNSLKNEFLAQVAHDLRTPLASVTWSAANLRDGLVGDLNEGQAAYLDSISSSASHLNRLVENLIEISQLDSGEIRFDPSDLELAEVLNEAVRTVRAIAETKDITIEVPKAGARVLANGDKLAVALVNLLDNAVKYSPPGGMIEIGMSENGAGQVEFTIRDHGPGFGDKKNLLQRFAQGAPSPYSQQRGFGLGLFIVKNYLERLGGTITVGDHPEGGGLVTCALPVAPR